MKTISVVISAWNEEAKIARCLESIQWADEIILVDNNSTDSTAKIGAKFKAKLYAIPNNPMLNVNKNYGFTKATGTWILCLDADEVVPRALAEEIRSSINTAENITGFWISRKNIIFGKWIQHGIWWPDRQLRLFRRGKGKFACLHVHEYLEVDGKTANLTVPYLHYNYETVSQYLRKMDTIYTQNEVEKQLLLNYQLSWRDAIKYPVSDFLKIYFAQEGYKDGLHGLILSLLQAFYSFLVFAKLWEKKGFTEEYPRLSDFNTEIHRSAREYNYWFYTTIINRTTSLFSVIRAKVLRKVYGKS